ncbi:MAG: response regulator transcription factor [Bacillales bacterium]|nr:response regulator transcription factor [Bacillales bacterium]
MMYKIGLVEDEKNLNSLVKNYLEKEGYEVITFFNGEDVLNYEDLLKVQLWILDIMLGDGINGYDIIKFIREKNKNVPVIFTSARDQDIDKIVGLELGSDDYIAKPYSPRELVLRINNIVKRVYNDEKNQVIYDDYLIDIDKRTVNLNEKEIMLTTLEFDLLLLFLENKNKSFSREEILEKVWGSDYFGSDRVVDDLVRRIRHKMPNLKINTLYGFGYRLL